MTVPHPAAAAGHENLLMWYGFAAREVIYMEKNIWVRSFGELKNLRNLTICGLMAALAVALNYTASFEVGPYIRIGISGLPNQVVAFLFGPGVGMIFGAMLDIIKYLLKPTGPFFPGFTLSAALGGMIYGLFLYGRKLPRIDLGDRKISVISASGIILTVAGEILTAIYGVSLLGDDGQASASNAYLIAGVAMLVLGSIILYYIFRHLFLAQLLVKIFVNIVLNTLWLKLLYDKAVFAILPGRLLSNTVMLPVDTLLLFAVLILVRRIVPVTYSEKAA